MKPILWLMIVMVGAADAFCATDSSIGGEFFREYWYERGTNFGNPKFDGRFRVNAPEVVLHPEFGKRVEVRENGMMQIFAGEDPRFVDRAELYLELWGGHPGTVNKRVSVNGRNTYKLPEVGTAQNHCTHEYPTIRLARTDLVNGFNAFQFACDQGSSFWGHFIVDNACLRAVLTNTHPALVAARLNDSAIAVRASEGSRGAVTLGLETPPAVGANIARVDFQGFYEGYDENGDGKWRDWHGFTKRRVPTALLGSATNAPFTVIWDTAMLPPQKDVSVRAWIRFKHDTNLVHVTALSRGIGLNDELHQRVRLVRANELPAPFWSRAGQKKNCTIDLNTDPERIESAEMHVVVWDGGAGNVRDYFTLNGHALKVAAGGRHDVIYSVVPIEPRLLRRGRNTIELLSDTDHHGIEVLLPGPALVVREAP